MRSSVDPELAASAGVAAGEAAAVLGIAAGQLGYELTLKALDESTAIAVLPLLLASLTGISAGLVAYQAVEVSAAAELNQVRQAFAQATATASAAYTQGVTHWGTAA